MNITQKEVITKIHAEISQEEFRDSYIEMMDAIISHDWIDEKVNSDTCKEMIDKYNSANYTNKKSMALESFYSPFGLLHTGTIRFIGLKYGYHVDNYGYVDGKTGLLNVVYYVRGNHL